MYRNAFILLTTICLTMFFASSCNPVPTEPDVSDKERSHQALLMTRAMYHSGQRIASDSLIAAAARYYALQGTAAEKASAFLYKGHVLEGLGQDAEALYAYKQAEEAVKTVKDLRLHFLIYTALGHINNRYAHYEISLAYYRKALDLQLSVSAWNAMGGSYVFAPLYLGQGKACYSENVRWVEAKFSDLVSRMDFSSQEKSIMAWH